MDNIQTPKPAVFYPPTMGQHTLSNNFKLWVVGFIFFMIFSHLFIRIAFPKAQIMSNELILSIVLGLILYLWTQELRDRYCIQGMNEEFVLAQKKLQNAEIDMITSLIKMFESKDPYELGHSSRVAFIAVSIARALNLSMDEQEAIRRSGLLHDLGKLIISDSILLKTEALTEEEWAQIKKHPQNTVNILESLKFLHLEKKIILHHHERFDGTGYPQGLQGGNIPLESRIIAVADTFDAMNSTRIHRKSCSKEFILKELQSGRGRQLDPTLVDHFLRMLDQNPDFWERDKIPEV
ncbi:MAG: HD-GYP domain-containing protein [Candidatus Omnitrophica bacterium]|nr:HD-GYP domain-containing protein [Candidatus Omnitrophota bacterium]